MAALNAIAARADGHNDEPNKAFGQLYVELNRAHRDKDEFVTFRKMLRDHIVEIWPVAAGDDILGIIQNERQLHSIASAALETGIVASLLKQFLVHPGAIAPDDDRSTARKSFDAKAHADLLAEIPTLIGSLEMQRRIGATKRQLVSLSKDNVLKPRIDIPMIKSP